MRFFKPKPNVCSECKVAFENAVTAKEKAENECLEQCRLLAMGGEREARLMAENATLREDAEKYRWLRKFEVDSFFASGKENRLDKSIDAARKE